MVGVSDPRDRYHEITLGQKLSKPVQSRNREFYYALPEAAL